jgi:asparagine synthase (glutamine-hydrolysing)
MCGIAGFIDDRLNAEESTSLLETMLEKIAHRGPDGRGKFVHGAVALGHNRLSILDLSEDGAQPMHLKHLSIVFNGEVYNYLEIRSELQSLGHTFHTGTDTEVVLTAYQQWGFNCVDKFVGMWAFAIWDDQEKLLFCSRDRFGIKPFYYLYEDGRFYFGSEYKALKVAPIFKTVLNYNQIFRGLQLGWNHFGSETYFDKLKALPNAHNLVFKDGNIQVKQYWDLQTVQSAKLSYSDAVSNFKSLFSNSIQLHMRSDVEVGCCLSGGLDSSAIASSVGLNFPDKKFKAFNVYYEGQDAVDERPWVKEVVKKYPSIDPYYFTPTDNDIRENFERAIYHADVPLAGSSPISQYFVMQLAAKHGIKVLLDGQGSDESLGGYMHSFYRLIGGLLMDGNFPSAFSELNAHKKMQQFSAGKSGNILLKSFLSGFQSEQRLYEMEYLHYLPFVGNSKQVNFDLQNKQGSRLNQFLYHLNFNTLLPSLLQFEDRNSMAFSIESRVPFLDHRLVENAFTLPDSFKINQGVTKRILRDSMQGILPEAIANRKDKKGFVTPGEIKWLRGPLSFLIEQDFSKIDFLEKEKVNRLITDFKAGDNKQANLVWRIAVLRYWLDKV